LLANRLDRDTAMVLRSGGLTDTNKDMPDLTAPKSENLLYYSMGVLQFFLGVAGVFFWEVSDYG
jgi:hypothetical protein